MLLEILANRKLIVSTTIDSSERVAVFRWFKRKPIAATPCEIRNGQLVWTQGAEVVVSRLIDSLSPAKFESIRNHIARLQALHIGCDMWSNYYLRPNGEVVVVGDELDHPDVDTIRNDSISVLKTLVWGAQRYPELRQLLPLRPSGAANCPCRKHPAFAEGRVLCPECGGLGWLPPDGNNRAIPLDQPADNA